MHSPRGVGPLDGGQGNVEVLGEEPALLHQELAALRVVRTQRADLRAGGVIHGRALGEWLPLHLFYPLTTFEPSSVRSLIGPSPTKRSAATHVIALFTGQGPASDAPVWRRPRGGWRPRRRFRGTKCRLTDPTHSSVAPVH